MNNSETATNILSVFPVTEGQKKKLLLAAGPGAAVSFSSIGQVTDQQLVSAHIILGNIPPSRLQAVQPENLRWLQLYSAGSDAYEAPGILPSGTLLTNATGAYGQSVSEHMLASLLTLQKRIHQYRDNQNRSQWRDEGPVCSISNNRVLIIGFGDIGQSLGRMLHALGNQITGIRRSTCDKPEWAEAVYPLEQLGRLLPEMDVAALCLPSSPATVNLFSKAQFAAMKPGSFFLNAGRGNLVDTEALLWALEAGPLAGAALDVTDPEPLPAGHPLWTQPNALVTPHISGGFHMPVTMERIVDIACGNLIRYQAGRTLRNLVTLP